MTILYQDNFDADTLGAIAPGWVNETGTWVVGTSGPISGARTFGNTSNSTGDFVVNNSIAATGPTKFQISYKIAVLPTAPTFGVAARLSGVGGSGYLVNPNLSSGSVGIDIFKKSGGSYSTLVPGIASGITTVVVGDTICVEILTNGTTIEGRVWNGTTGTRPTSPSITGTDSSYATGVTGVYFGAPTGASRGFDDAIVQDLAASFTAGAITVGAVTSTTASLTVTAPSGGTAPYANQWYRSTTSGFTPGSGNIVTGATGLTLNDTGLTAATTYFYKVIQTDSAGTPATATTTQQSVTTATSSAAPVTIDRLNAALKFSPGNWFDDGTAMVSANTGAYVKFSFTGTSIALNTEALASMSAYPQLRCFIDDQQYDVGLSTATQFAIASGLAAGTHSFELHYRASLYSAGSWWNGVNALKIAGFQIDNGSTVSAPTIRSKVMFAFGDSLTQGYFVNSTTSPSGDDALATYVGPIAKALDAEYGQVGWGGSNYAAAGVSDVPAFNTSYASVLSGHSRLTSGQFTTQPDYITVMLGTNGSTAQSDVATAITNLRAAAPNAAIFIVVPGGGYGRAAETAAVTAAADAKVFLIDAGTSYQNGISTATPSAYSFDGTHYKVTKYAFLGAKWMQQINTKLLSTGTYPTAAQVLTGITFGPTNNLTGNVTQPPASAVSTGTQYGAAGTQYTGTYTGSGSGTYPTAAQVLSGIVFGPSGSPLTGNVTLPTVGNVVSGVTYGSNGSMTGTYASSGGTVTITSAIRIGPAVVLIPTGQVVAAI